MSWSKIGKYFTNNDIFGKNEHNDENETDWNPKKDYTIFNKFDILLINIVIWREGYRHANNNKTWKHTKWIISYLGLENSVDRFLNISFENMGLGQLFVPVSGQPNSGQGALFGQHKVRVKHFCGSFWFCERRIHFNILSTRRNVLTTKLQRWLVRSRFYITNTGIPENLIEKQLEALKSRTIHEHIEITINWTL